MLKNLKDKMTLSGITVLMIGVALLIATFISAYGFLSQSLSILTSGDLVGIFGAALAPLIATCIRIMYLGVMGWIGSLLTIRGVSLIVNAPKVEAVPPQKPAVPMQKPVPPQKAKAEAPKEAKPEVKPEAKPPEPEFVVIPPEQVAPEPPQQQPQQPQQQPPAEQKEQPKNNNSQPQPSNQ